MSAPVRDELSIDPDGDVALDWRSPTGGILSLSVAPSGRACFAWDNGARRGSGQFGLPAEAFAILKECVAPVVANVPYRLSKIEQKALGRALDRSVKFVDSFDMPGISEAVWKAGGQKALGQQLGVSQQAVSSWMKAGFVPRRHVAAISERYGIDRVRLAQPL